MTTPETPLQFSLQQTDNWFSFCSSCVLHYFNERGNLTSQKRLLPPLNAIGNALELGYETFRSNLYIAGVEYIDLFSPKQIIVEPMPIAPALLKELFAPKRTIYFGTLLQYKDLPSPHPSLPNEGHFVPTPEDWLCRTRSGHFYFLTPENSVVMARYLEIYDRLSGLSHVRTADKYEGYLIYQKGRVLPSHGRRTRLFAKIRHDAARQKGLPV